MAQAHNSFPGNNELSGEAGLNGAIAQRRLGTIVRSLLLVDKACGAYPDYSAYSQEFNTPTTMSQASPINGEQDTAHAYDGRYAA